MLHWRLYRYGLLEQSLHPSIRANNPNDARYGDGKYLSDIVPGTKTNAQLSRSFVGHPFQGNHYSQYIEIDVTNLPVMKGRENVSVIPNDNALDLNGRIANWGSNS